MSSSAAGLLYLVFILGAVGVYYLLPRTGPSKTLVGAVFGVLAVVALLVLWAIRVISPTPTSGYFYLFATIAILAATRVVTHPKPVHCALYFVLVVVAVAALLVLQLAEFLAVALIIIYAGAIVVTYLFVIMLSQQGRQPMYDRRAREPFLAVLAGFVLMAGIAGRAGELPEQAAPSSVQVHQASALGLAASVPPGNTAAMGAVVMTRYVVALEIAGVLLLVAMVGAIALSRKRVPAESYEPPRRAPGQVGKEVPPY